MAKKELKESIQSVFDKMAEAYRDIDTQKTKILSSLKARKNAWNAEDIEDAIILAKAETDDYKLLDNLIDKKIKLIQIHSKLVTPSQKLEETVVAATQQILTDNVMKELRELAEEENQTEVKYSLDTI